VSQPVTTLATQHLEGRSRLFAPLEGVLADSGGEGGPGGVVSILGAAREQWMLTLGTRVNAMFKMISIFLTPKP